MPSYHSDVKFSLELVQNYFAHLNPIAERIANDIKDTKGAYGPLWQTLNTNEQNDIINETLIQPEISLKYFDQFSSSSELVTSSSSSSQSSNSVSADSLAAVVLNNINNTLGGKTQNEQVTMKTKPHDKIQTKKDKKNPITNMKQYYAFDGRNLKTYALQKVALKIVQDDALGAYRDEHSMPFSYLTRSQINLRSFNNNSDTMNNCFKEDEVSLVKDRASVENYKKLQKELKLSLIKEQSKSKPPVINENKPNYERFDNTTTKQGLNVPMISKPKAQAPRPQVKPPPAPINNSQSLNAKNKKPVIVDCKKLESLVTPHNQFQNPTSGNAQVKSYHSTINSNPMTYAVYSDTYFDHGESSNLMQNAINGSNGLLTASSSSAATSDEDDDKTICEEVKLLDNDVNLRKGFDFLNNW